MFSDELEKYSWEDITACIASKRSRDVEIALGKEHLQLDDFMALCLVLLVKSLPKTHVK